MRKYAAKLLFQFRVITKGISNRRRLCEERIILVKAADAREALRTARREGREVRLSYHNDAGGKVCFDFIGVIDLIEIGRFCTKNEVWYDYRDAVRPSERHKQFVPPEHTLTAIVNEEQERSQKRSPKRRQTTTAAKQKRKNHA